VTLERTLPGELTDTSELARDYDDLDHEEVNRIFVQDLLGAGEVGDDFLDVGTGTARIPVELCEQNETCRVMASDLSFAMLDLARLNIEIAGLIDRIQLDRVDAQQMHYADAYFDVVMSNSFVHQLSDPAPMLQHAVRVLRPGGLLFFRDLLRPASESEIARLIESAYGDANPHQQQMFDAALRSSLSVEEMASLVEQLGFPPASVEITSDRHWTWSTRKPAN
jgi:ubiquinone/menaquinone biosynthesis C-methylase UbiE